MAESKFKCENDILCGINLPKDKKNLVDLEKKHMPVISAPKKVKKDSTFEVDIKVGGIDGIEHPNEPAHFIEWIELYSGDTFLGRAGFGGGISYGVAKFKVKLSHSHGILKALAKCNLHGTWQGTADIIVE